MYGGTVLVCVCGMCGTGGAVGTGRRRKGGGGEPRPTLSLLYCPYAVQCVKYQILR